MDTCMVTVTLWHMCTSYLIVSWLSAQRPLLVLQAASTVTQEPHVTWQQQQQSVPWEHRVIEGVTQEQQHTPRARDADNSIICHVCGKRFVSRVGHKLHVAMHKGQYPYHCQHCGQGFSSTTNLKGHLVRHTGVKAFACPICPETFKYRYMVKTHMEKVHTTSDPECRSHEQHTRSIDDA